MPYVTHKSNVDIEADDRGEYGRRYLPKQQVRFSGIYRCENCKAEEAVSTGKAIPEHSCHSQASTPIHLCQLQQE